MAAMVTGCASPESNVETGDDANLTQAPIDKPSDPAVDALRADFERARGGERTGFYGEVSVFKWGTNQAIGEKLTSAQLDILANELIHSRRAAKDRIPYSLTLHAAEIGQKADVAQAELRLSEGPAAAAVDAAIEKARAAGRTIALYAPKVAVPDAKRTAGALIVVDVPHREAMVLYGRRGADPYQVECKVTEMHSHEWEEALSKDEYPDVDAQEVPLTGDVLLDVGANATLSNADAAEEHEDYRVVLKRDGAKTEIEAGGASFRAKLVVDGAVGTVYGDRDGNNRPNKAATLACTSR